MAQTRLHGKVAVVTGANSGLGKATAEALACSGAHVVMTGRSESRLEQAQEAIRNQWPDTRLVTKVADFARLSEVRKLGHHLRVEFPCIDILVNNAGVALFQRTVTEEGHEMTLTVNHLAPFLLTHLLLPSLRRAQDARIINVSSEGYRWAELDFDDLHVERRYSIQRAYGKSKLCGLLFTHALADRLGGTNITVNAAHPGRVNTGIGTGGTRVVQFFWGIAKMFTLSPKRGARTQVWLATSPELAGQSGGYYARCAPATLLPVAQDDASAARLWAVSCELTGIDGDRYGEDLEVESST